MPVKYPANLILLDLIVLIIFASNIFSLCSSLKVLDQISYSGRTTRKIKVLHILIYTFLDSRRIGLMVASIARLQSP
jgi:hypothetical protein